MLQLIHKSEMFSTKPYLYIQRAFRISFFRKGRKEPIRLGFSFLSIAPRFYPQTWLGLSVEAHWFLWKKVCWRECGSCLWENTGLKHNVRVKKNWASDPSWDTHFDFVLHLLILILSLYLFSLVWKISLLCFSLSPSHVWVCFQFLLS